MTEENNFIGTKNPYVNSSNKDTIETLNKVYKESQEKYKKLKKENPEKAKQDSYERAIKNREAK